MVGELSALHAFVVGGDKRESPARIPTGFLGAVLQKDARGAVIGHIYRNDPDYPETSSPLGRPELRIHEGDVITAGDNMAWVDVSDILLLLWYKAGVSAKKLSVEWEGLCYYEIV